MPPKLELPIKKLNLLITCHDKKIESLGRLIQKIFNMTDKSLGISKEVTYAIQNLKLIPLTNKELSKSNLEKTNNLIKTIKTLQQTTKGTGRQIGLTDSYKQLVKAIVEYAKKIKCPKKKPETDFSEFTEMINDLYFLEEKYREYYRSNNNQCKTESCEVITLNGLAIQKTSQYKNFFDLYRTKLYNDENWLTNFKNFLTSYRYGDYSKRIFSSKRGGLISQLTILNSRLNKKRKQQGGSKHHKTKTTKKRIKGKQTRRNKVKNKTTIKAKNKTTIKVKNKTTIKAKNKTKKR